MSITQRYLPQYKTKVNHPEISITIQDKGQSPRDIYHSTRQRSSPRDLYHSTRQKTMTKRYLTQYKVSKGAKIRNRHNKVPHLTQDTNEKVTNSQLDTTNESQEVSHFPAGDHKAHINRGAQRHSKHKTEET